MKAQTTPVCTFFDDKPCVYSGGEMAEMDRADALNF
jgi:hypothetical protein